MAHSFYYELSTISHQLNWRNTYHVQKDEREEAYCSGWNGSGNKYSGNTYGIDVLTAQESQESSSARDSKNMAANAKAAFASWGPASITRGEEPYVLF